MPVMQGRSVNVETIIHLVMYMTIMMDINLNLLIC